MLFFGSAIFKIGRLLFIAMMSVHLFACAYFRVKKETSSEEDMEGFYLARNVISTVRMRNESTMHKCIRLSMLLVCRIFQRRM